jgi:hypothetical protein
MQAKKYNTQNFSREEQLIFLLVKASRKWKRPPDYIMIKKETGLNKNEVMRLLQRYE